VWSIFGAQSSDNGTLLYLASMMFFIKSFPYTAQVEIARKTIT
jgi:hypothetical protein